MPSPKIVLDTNVLVSAFVFKGACGQILDWCIEYSDNYVSPWILNEVTRVLIEKIKLPEDDVREVIAVISNKDSFSSITPSTTLPTVCRDSDDNNILQLAESVGADYIVTGDKDLLVLEKFLATVILSPKEFLQVTNG